MDSIPPICKHTFTPEVDPTELIDDEDEFEALSGINWSSSTFQPTEEDEEPAKDDTEDAERQGQAD